MYFCHCFIIYWSSSVDLHIFFFFGFVVVSAFIIDALVNGKSNSAKQLAGMLTGQVLVSLINPHFHKGLLAPLTIFNEYGYMVAENQPIWFMHERFGNPELYHFEIFAVLSVALISLLFIKNLWKPIVSELLLCIAFLALSTFAVRAIPMFALFLIPIGAAVFNHLLESLNFKTKERVSKVLPYVGVLFLIVFIPLKGTYASAQK